MEARTHVTRDDLIRGGACRIGVDDFIRKHAHLIRTVMAVDDILSIDDGARDIVMAAAGLDNDGDNAYDDHCFGYGSDDDGDSDGFGHGSYGHGRGDGDADEYGDIPF